MMKKIALLFFGMMMLSHLFAQEFLPVLRMDAEWTILHQIDKGLSNPRDTITEHYRLGGDTIIDEIVWKKIFFSTDTIFSWDDPDLQFGGIIREENGRVYYAGDRIRYHTSGNLIYDFNLEEGDAFWEGTDDKSEPMNLIVYSIDTVFLRDNVPRKRYHLRFTRLISGFTDQFDTCTWVEGLGDISNGLLHQYFPPDAGPDIRRSDKLICYTVNEGLVFESPNFAGCFFERITTKTMDRFIGKIRIFPNPVRHHVNMLFDTPLAITQVRVSNQWGHLVFQDRDLLITKDYQIDSSNWPSGVYFISVDTKGESYTFKVIHY